MLCEITLLVGAVVTLVSLNPCFNGRCSARQLSWRIRYRPCVLILVLMEDALRGYSLTTLTLSKTCLNPCSNGRCSASPLGSTYNPTGISVLILVLMEDALRELNLRRAECQLVTALFSRNPLDFRGKSVPNCLQIYEFPRLCLTLSERSHE